MIFSLLARRVTLVTGVIGTLAAVAYKFLEEKDSEEVANLPFAPDAVAKALQQRGVELTPKDSYVRGEARIEGSEGWRAKNVGISCTGFNIPRISYNKRTDGYFDSLILLADISGGQHCGIVIKRAPGSTNWSYEPAQSDGIACYGEPVDSEAQFVQGMWTCLFGSNPSSGPDASVRDSST